jgi:hypothetical protein
MVLKVSAVQNLQFSGFWNRVPWLLVRLIGQRELSLFMKEKNILVAWLQESWDSRIRSWASRDSKLIVNVLAKAGRNLLVCPFTGVRPGKVADYTGKQTRKISHSSLHWAEQKTTRFLVVCWVPRRSPHRSAACNDDGIHVQAHRQQGDRIIPFLIFTTQMKY